MGGSTVYLYSVVRTYSLLLPCVADDWSSVASVT